MKPSELLREVKRRVLRPNAWTPFDNFGQFGWPNCGCIMNHFWHVVETERGLSGSHPVASAAQRAMEASNVRGTIIRLNDHGPTRLWGVVAMLGRAIRRLEAEGK